MVELLTKRCTADGCRVAVVRYPRGLHQPSHAHSFTSISLVLRGGVREDVGHETVCAGVMDLVVKPAGTRHENRFLEADTTIVQLVPGDDGLRRGIDAGSPLVRWSWSDGAPAAGCAPPWLRRAREALHGKAPPAIADLAADAGVHRVHFSREFRRHFGVSPSEYRLRARLRAASRAVAAPGRSLAASACEAGFADQAHMNREFRQRLGLTPHEFRRLVSSRPAA